MKEFQSLPIPINPDTHVLGGDLDGHKLDHICDAGEERFARGTTYVPRDLFEVLDRHKPEADLWWYKSDMPLCGTSGYAVVLGEYVLKYAPVVIH